MPNIDLASRAMLVTLTVSQWSARKFDRKASRDFNSSHDADEDASRVNKVLVARNRIAEVTKAGRLLREKHTELTLPWKQDGQRLLPATEWMAYSEEIRKLRAAFEQAATEFCRDYPALVDEARGILKGLYNPDDYPSADSIRDKFSVSVSVDPVPTAKDFRVSLSDEITAAIRDQIEKDNAVHLDKAIGNVWGRLYDCVARMANDLPLHGKTLPGREKAYGFRDSVVTNLRDVVSAGPAMNICDDGDLDEVLAECSEQLCKHTPGALRRNATLRKSVANSAKAIAERIAEIKGYRDEDDVEPVEFQTGDASKAVDEAMSRMGAFMGATA